MSKKIVHVSRAFKLKRAGHDPVVFQAGRNEVDEDVADHPYVQAHLTSAPQGTADAEMAAALEAANARIVELEATVASRDAEMAAVLASVKPAKK